MGHALDEVEDAKNFYSKNLKKFAINLIEKKVN